MENLVSNTSIKDLKTICDVGVDLFDTSNHSSSSTGGVNHCFDSNYLAWPPAIFLLCGTVYQIYSLVTQKRLGRLKWTWLLVAKLLISIILIASTGALLGLQISRLSRAPWGAGVWSTVGAVLLWLCVVQLLILTEVNRRHGRVTSGIVYMGWLALVICGSIRFAQSIVQLKSNVENRFAYAQDLIYACSYILMIVEVILHSFADRREARLLHLDELPEENCSFLSLVTFSWVIKLAIQCYRHSLWRRDLWPLPPKLAASYAVPKWERRWQAALAKQRAKSRPSTVVDENSESKNVTTNPTGSNKRVAECPSLVWTLVKTFKWNFIPALFMKFVGDLLLFAGPLILKILLVFMDDPEMPLWIGLAFAFLMLLCNVINTILANQAEYEMNKLALNVRTALCSTVYKKALRLSAASKRTSSMGEMVDLMAVDTQHMSDVSEWLYQIWSAPFVVSLTLYLLYNELGYSGLVGFLVMLVLSPMNFYLSRLQQRREQKAMTFKDRRMVLMNEILNGMKILKLYAWEKPFESKINKIRADEVKVLKTGSYFDAIYIFIFDCAPFLIALASFTTFALSSPDHILTVERLFVSLSLFYMLRPTINMIPEIISSVVVASVSNKRLRRFLAEPELQPRKPDISPDSLYGDGKKRNDGAKPAAVAKRRTSAFSLDEGSEAEETSKKDNDAIRIRNGTFVWDANEPQPTLKDINLSIKAGQLVAIVGPVGCGKSSLLSAMLGDMETRGGSASTKGSLAYVPQLAWIQTMSLRSNITFLRPYSEVEYKRAVDACALKPDFEILAEGDMTEIGENGINLSGGQKQRVSLARAVYQNRDVYLFDDPLSAVDAHVGRHIFDNVLGDKGLLKKKTRVLVTHGLSYLKHMDNIFVMTDGRISDQGTLSELIRRKGPFAEFLDTYLTKKSATVDETDDEGEDDVFLDELAREVESVDPQMGQRLRRMSSDLSNRRSSRRRSRNASRIARERTASTASRFKSRSVSIQSHRRESSVSPSVDGVHEVGQSIRHEEVRTGTVEWSVYKNYAHAVGYLSLIGIVFGFVASSSMNLGGSVWMSEWSQDSKLPANESTSVETRLGVYAAFGFAQGFFLFLAALMTSRFMIAASARLHQRLLSSLLHSPMSFFETTPHGAVINRFGKDLDALDNMLPVNTRLFLDAVLKVVTAVIVMIIGTPWVLGAVIPLAILYMIFRKFSISTSRQMRRLEASSRAPIYSYFSETLAGVSSIRAFGAEDRFIQETHYRIDENMRAIYARIAASLWIAVTLDLMGTLLILACSLLAVIMRENSNSGWAGLSITYAMTVTHGLMISVLASSNLENNVVSVERVMEYIDLPSEAAWTTDVRPPKDWPSQGAIQFDQLQLRYRPELDLVLKGLDWRVGAQEKVGVVGRTGAGKSSTALALFRTVEPCGGRILIDGVDIAEIGLHDLRSRLAIIPQDPVLFSGSLRSNLDPFDEHGDSQIWQALEQAHMKPFVAKLDDKLQYQVAEGGDNLSLGQRQLVCLARALLRRSRILILDEATASVDMETESLILDTIRSKLSECTIITIAHRLDTILDNDKVLVMSNGRASEYDSPKALLDDPDSAFFSMAKDAGIVKAAK